MSTKMTVVSTKYETENLTLSEVKKLRSYSQSAMGQSSGSGYLNKFQTYMAIWEGSRIAGVLSVFFGDFISSFKDLAQDDFNFANNVYYAMTETGYDLAKVKIKFEKLKVTDSNSGAVVGYVWRCAGRREMVALHHPAGGWDMME